MEDGLHSDVRRLEGRSHADSIEDLKGNPLSGNGIKRGYRLAILAA